MVSWLIPDWLSNLALTIFGAWVAVALYFHSQKQSHYALWSWFLAAIFLLLVVAMHRHNRITSKEMQHLQVPEISVGIFPLVDQHIRYANSTQHKYPFDEYTLSISNKNKKSASVYDLTIEFSFPYVISKVEGGPILESGGDVTVGRPKVVEREGNKMSVTEEQPVATTLDKSFSLEIQTSRQGNELVHSNTVVFFCKEWPEIAWYEGSIVVDLTKKPSFIKGVSNRAVYG